MIIIMQLNLHQENFVHLRLVNEKIKINHTMTVAGFADEDAYTLFTSLSYAVYFADIA